MKSQRMFKKYFLVVCLLSFCQAIIAQKVQLDHFPKDQKVVVKIDDELFTNYIYPDDLEKAVLFPVVAANGKLVTRGFPLDPRPREKVDHPHHIGIWLNYGDVNGLDFWNNSYAISEDKKAHYGAIYHSKIDRIESGEKGILSVTSDWKSYEGNTLLKEETDLIFSSIGNTRFIDRITKLTAVSADVSFEDSKEGMYAIRVARELELPGDQPEHYINLEGKVSQEKRLDNEGVSGNYRSSEGLEGKDVWGTRGNWTKLQGVIEGDTTSISIIDHPDNIGYPTFWMARGYGLFAANPLGQKVYSEGQLELNFQLAKGDSVVFKYRMIIHWGSDLTDEFLRNEAKRFTDEY